MSANLFHRLIMKFFLPLLARRYRVVFWFIYNLSVILFHDLIIFGSQVMFLEAKITSPDSVFSLTHTQIWKCIACVNKLFYYILIFVLLFLTLWWCYWFYFLFFSSFLFYLLILFFMKFFIFSAFHLQI